MAPYHPVDDWSYTEDDKVVDVTIGTTDDDAYPSGWRYALHYGTVDGETILRYDNAHGDTKGHEKHTGGDVESVDFPGMTPLYEEFPERVRADLEGLPR
ncbi:toxin-antitoxin system TumE family protein [Halosimplex pelagicum]|uniref:Uncharacterized protein n=1 Tax=Halosimplex pelagicum TaxID=869886 RepID=A0A7D5TG56_9EURY|nr:DUF6516 family protein [Halosimplex pelagicum]QLH81196.1 hypothetical protein HZS54_05875 [Halosimplex pelagicum]